MPRMICGLFCKTKEYKIDYTQQKYQNTPQLCNRRDYFFGSVVDNLSSDNQTNKWHRQKVAMANGTSCFFVGLHFAHAG